MNNYSTYDVNPEHENYLAYQEWLNSRRSDLAGDLGLLVTSTLVMPIESKLSLNTIETTDQPESPEALVFDERPEVLAKLSHIAVASTDSAEALQRAIESPSPYRETHALAA